MITVTTTIVADNTDILSGSDLATAPDDGVASVYIGSTQNDSIVTISAPPLAPVVRLGKIPQKTNGVPSLTDDVPWAVPITAGGRLVINIDIVTAATIVIIVIFQSLQELGL